MGLKDLWASMASAWTPSPRPKPSVEPVHYSRDGKPFWLIDADGKYRSPDGMALPSVFTFASFVQGANKTYWHLHSDEARRHSRENAIAMRRDLFLMRLLKERKRGTTSKKWHLEPDDPRDPYQKAAAEAITKVVKAIPRFRRIQTQLLEALWYGRYAVQIKPVWKEMSIPTIVPTAGPGGMVAPTMTQTRRRVLTVEKHRPVNGDKIDYHHDGTPYILVNSFENYKDAELIQATEGTGLLLRGSWRNRFIIHSHDPDDSDYLDGEMAGAIYGVGIRSRAYWLQFLKNDYSTWYIDALQKTGLGIIVIEYDISNPASKTEAIEASKKYNRKDGVLLVPRSWDGRGGESVRVVETPVAGIDILRQLQARIDEILEQYIIGQTMSGGADNESGLGGSGRAAFAMDTKAQIIEEDALELAETLTGSDHEPGLINQIFKYTFPEFVGEFPAPRFVFDTPEPGGVEKAQIMVQIAQAFPGEARFRWNDLYDLIGVSKGEDGDDIIGAKTAEMMAQQQAQTQQGDEAGKKSDKEGDDAGGGDEPEESRYEDSPDDWDPLPDGSGLINIHTGEVISGDDPDLSPEDERLLEELLPGAGGQVNYEQDDWKLFRESTGTLGIPRADMPQIKSEHRGALANYLRARGIPWDRQEVLPGELKPTQAEYSDEKLKKARQHDGERAILVSREGYVVDGHHQWLAALKDRPKEKMPVIRLDALIGTVLSHVLDFPSCTTVSYADEDLPFAEPVDEKPKKKPKSSRPASVRVMGGYTKESPFRLGGREYLTGQRIPAADLERATPDELALLGRHAPGYESPWTRQGNAWIHRQTGERRYQDYEPLPQYLRPETAAAIHEQRTRPPQLSFPSSRLSRSEENAHNLWEDYFGQPYSHESMARLLGSAPGSHWRVYGDPTYLGAYGDSHAINQASRAIRIDPKTRQPYISNQSLFLRPSARGQGLGLSMFRNQVQEAANLGMQHIQTTAGKGHGMSGWAVWPKMGYNMDLDDHIRRKLPKELQGAKTLQQLLAMPGGGQWWAGDTWDRKNSEKTGRRGHGEMANLKFDLTPGSESMQALNRYLAAKGLPPIQVDEARRNEIIAKRQAAADPSNAGWKSVRNTARALGISRQEIEEEMQRAPAASRSTHPDLQWQLALANIHTRQEFEAEQQLSAKYAGRGEPFGVNDDQLRDYARALSMSRSSYRPDDSTVGSRMRQAYLDALFFVEGRGDLMTPEARSILEQHRAEGLRVENIPEAKPVDDEPEAKP